MYAHWFRWHWLHKQAIVPHLHQPHLICCRAAVAVTSTAQEPRDKASISSLTYPVRKSILGLCLPVPHLTPVLLPAKACKAQSCSEPSQRGWCCACSVRAVPAGACWCSPAASLLHGPEHACLQHCLAKCLKHLPAYPLALRSGNIWGRVKL